MAYEKKDGSGALFKNDRREKETHPEYRGDILIDGQEYWLSAWVKEGQKGKFFSLSAQPKQDRGRAPAQRETQRSQQKPAQQRNPVDDFEDDSVIPF